MIYMELKDLFDQTATDLMEDPTAQGLLADVVGDHSAEWLEGFIYALRSNITLLSTNAMEDLLTQSTALSMLEQVLEQKKAEATQEEDAKKIYGD